MARLFDSHAHYDDSRLREGRDALLTALFQGDVGCIVNIGTNIKNSLESVSLACEYPNIYAAVGIHPSDCGDISDEAETLYRLRRMLAMDKVVALGEIGLDYHYDDVEPATQLYWFEKQMALAEETGKPVVIHDREAHGACMEVVRRYPKVKGVFHSFSGSCEMAAELTKMGWYISFSGVITFKNAQRVREVVKSVPVDRILVETDCPYLAPEPKRGQTNHSGYVAYTAEKMAEIRGVTYEEICNTTFNNACRFFSISPEALN